MPTSPFPRTTAKHGNCSPPEHSEDGGYGDGYNGRSVTESDAHNGWLKENISLNAYVGQPIQFALM
ncbi:MAG: hypothetical protein HC804_08395 [Anaerolineae bacterium]|nr:hypothetical protein [Anaerolineae bacterium]